MFVKHCKTRGLPLDVTQVAPEVRASESMADATAKARSDELIRLRHDLAIAQAAESAAKGELERERGEFEALKQKALKLEVSLGEQRRQVDALLADKAASDELMAESAKKLTEAEQRAKQAEANLLEYRRQGAGQEKSGRARQG